MRSPSLLHLLLPLLLISLSACCEDDPFTATRKTRDYPWVDPSRAAYIRVIHAAATGPDVVVYFDSIPYFRGRIQEYFRFQAGVNEAHFYPIDIETGSITFRTESGAAVASLAGLALERGEYYTIYFYGGDGAYGVRKTSDRPLPEPGTEATRLRVINLSPGSSAFRNPTSRSPRMRFTRW